MSGDIESVFREERGRAVSVITRAIGDLDIAEEAVQEAFVAALRTWPVARPPPRPVTGCCAAICGPRRSGWAGCCIGRCPTSRSRPACWR